MQSQRTAREPERELAGVVPVAMDYSQSPVVVSARSPPSSEEADALRAQLSMEIYALDRNRIPPELSGEEALLTRQITTLAALPEGETRAERLDPEFLDLFTDGKIQFITVFVPQDDAYKQETLRQMQEGLIPVPGGIPHYTVQVDPNDPNIAIIRNNWFVPFPDEERGRIVDYLSAAMSLDGTAMEQALLLYTKMRELATKTYALRASETVYGGVVGGELGEIISSYDQLESHVLTALQAIAEGTPGVESLISETAPLAESAEQVYNNAYFRIAEELGAYDPAPPGSELRATLDKIENPSGAWSEELNFSPVEIQYFHALYDNYSALLEKVRERRYELAAFILGYAPGTTIHPPGGTEVTVEGLTQDDIMLFRQFRSAAGSLQLFTAKAKFLDIQAEYGQYQSFLQDVTPDAGSVDEIIDGMASRGELPSSISNFRANRENYSRALSEIQDQLVAYGEMIEDAIVRNTPDLTAYFGEDEKKAFFAEMRGLGEQGAGSAGDLGSMMAFSSRYLGALAGGMHSIFSRAQEMQEDLDLETRYREGGFWDKAYAFSKYFLKERGTEFLVLSTIATAGIGAAVGAAGAGIRATAYAFGRAGFAAAAMLEAPMASVVLADSVYHLGDEGIAGERAYEDLRLATQFLMFGGTAWAGGTGMVSKIFSTALFGEATLGSGLSVYEDVRRGDVLSAVADTIVYAAGGYMFIRGINGIQQLRLTETAAASEFRVGTPFGLQAIQLPKVAEWVTFPYTAQGASTFYLSMWAIEPLFNPEEVAAALASEDGIDALRSHFNEIYAAYGYTFPAANLVLEGALAAGGAVYRSIRGAARPPELAASAAAAAESLQISVSDPALMACAATAGVGDNAILLAKQIGLDLEDKEVLRRIYTIALGDVRMSADEVVSYLSPYRPAGATEAQFRRFAQKLSEETAETWENSRTLLYAGEVSSAERGGIRRMFSEAVRNHRRLIGLGLANVGLGAIGYARTLDSMPYYKELYESQRAMQGSLDTLAGNDANKWLADMLLRGDFPGFSRASSPQEQELFLNSASIVANRIEQDYGDYSWFSGQLKALLPDPQARFNLVYAASLALLSRDERNPEAYLDQLANLVGNLSQFFASQPDLDWKGMEMGDFFMVSNYLLSLDSLENAQGQLEGLVSGFRSEFQPYVPSPLADPYMRAMDMISRTTEAVADPNFARAAVATLYQSNLAQKPEGWAQYAILTLFNVASEDENYRLHPAQFFSQYRGEVLAELLGSEAFLGSPVDLATFGQLVLSTYDRYPMYVYHPETRRFFNE